MVRNGSPFPVINWFEFQVLSQLMGEDRYGNQILLCMQEMFGPDVVYSGKLYPTLQRLEKKGFIHKKDAQAGGDSARGVDPIYYSLTGRGKAELQKATMMTAATFFQGAVEEMRVVVARRVMEIIGEEVEAPLTMGVAVLGSEKSIGPEAMAILEGGKGITPLLIYVDGLCGKCRLCHGGLPGDRAYTTVKATPEDVPLKDGYLDVLVTVVMYRGGDDWLSFMGEALRAVRPGGLVLMVEFGKFNSFILEVIMNSMHKSGGAVCDLVEVEEAMITGPLEGRLVDVTSDRINEMIIVHGRRA